MCHYIAKVGASKYTIVLDSCFVNFNYRFRMTLQNYDMKVKMLAVWTDSMCARLLWKSTVGKHRI